VKLKQALEEHESRFVKLEQNDKYTASENAKLKVRVAKLEHKPTKKRATILYYEVMMLPHLNWMMIPEKSGPKGQIITNLQLIPPLLKRKILTMLLNRETYIVMILLQLIYLITLQILMYVMSLHPITY